MMYKYLRIFTVAGRMQWDSVRDDADLKERVVATMDTAEKAQFEDEREALDTPGGTIIFPYMVLVRVTP